MTRAIRSAEHRQERGDAEEVVLYHRADAEIRGQTEARTRHRIVVRALRDGGGIESGVLLPISSELRVKNLKGWMISPGGAESKLPKDQRIEIDSFESVTYHDESRILGASFENLEAGGVVAYEYEVAIRDISAATQEFIFQLSAPLVGREYRLRIPKGWSLLHASTHLDGVEPTRDGRDWIWRVEDLGPQPDEPLGAPITHLARRLMVVAADRDSDRSIETWGAVGRWYTSLVA